MQLEILNGPLDGQIITIGTETFWDKAGDGPLSFPWDAELGDKQARFFIDNGSWWIEAYESPHGTYCLNREQRVEQKMQIEQGDFLKASETWLLINQID